MEPATDPVSGEALIPTRAEENGASCGLVDVEHEIVRPNFYFVLDASSSMQELMPNSGGTSRHLAARRAILDMLRHVGHRVNFGAALFPDPDEADGCSAGREVFGMRPGEPLADDGSDNDLLEALAFTLRKYSPDGATPVTSTLEMVAKTLETVKGPTALFLLTDGAPNCDLEEPCALEQCIPNIESAEFQGGPRCNEEFNCCAPDFLPHLCLDENDASRRLKELSDGGTPTYVIGIPGSEVYADVLDAMAIAAGTDRGGDSAYYSVTDASDLALTLTDLGQQLSASCGFDLGSPPENAELLRVLLDGDETFQDEPDGWEWTGDQSIALKGTACDAWRASEILRVRVVESCKVEVR